jgi:hypothetical protein
VLDIKVLFIDDGGVMNDNTRRTPQLRRLVGEYFAPRLGGEPAAWAEASRGYAEERVVARYLEAGWSPADRSIRTVLAEWDQAWLREPEIWLGGRGSPTLRLPEFWGRWPIRVWCSFAELPVRTPSS